MERKRQKEKQQEGARYEEYRKHLKEIKKHQKEKEESQIRKNMQDYHSYQNNRRVTSSYSLTRTRESPLADKNGKRDMTSRRGMYNSYMQTDNDQLDGKLVTEKLKSFHKRMLESSERRDRELKTRVQPIKEHLNRISQVLKVMHHSKRQFEEDTLLSYKDKDKHISEVRKRRKKKLESFHMSEKEMNLSVGKH